MTYFNIIFVILDFIVNNDIISTPPTNPYVDEETTNEKYVYIS